MTVRLPGRSGPGNGITGQGKRHIELGCCGSAADDVRADSQPVRGQVGVADPSLQIFWRRNHFRRRQIEEISTGRQNLGAEEIVACRQNDGASERDRDLYFFTRRRTFPAGRGRSNREIVVVCAAIQLREENTVLLISQYRNLRLSARGRFGQKNLAAGNTETEEGHSYVNGRMATLSPTKPAVPWIKGF